MKTARPIVESRVYRYLGVRPEEEEPMHLEELLSRAVEQGRDVWIIVREKTNRTQAECRVMMNSDR